MKRLTSLLLILTLLSGCSLLSADYLKLATRLAEFIAGVTCPDNPDIKSCLIEKATKWIAEHSNGLVAELLKQLLLRWSKRWGNLSTNSEGVWYYPECDLVISATGAHELKLEILKEDI